jgi:rare lipoprotein A
MEPLDLFRDQRRPPRQRDQRLMAARSPFLAMALLSLLLAACSTRLPDVPADPASTRPHGTYKLGSAYQINGIWYYPEYDPAYDQVGIASWYGRQFHGRATANGEVFDMRQISAAHPTLPMPSLVEVTNLENGRSLRLRVNDRGPFHDNRLIDLSQAAARELGFEGKGLARVRVRFVALLPAANGTPPVAGTTTRPTVVAAAAPAPRSPARTRPAVRQAAAATSSGCDARDTHFVQVAAFGDSGNAERLAAELDRLGTVGIDAAGAALNRVRLGPYPSRRDAFGKLAEVRGLGYRDAMVISCS